MSRDGYTPDCTGIGPDAGSERRHRHPSEGRMLAPDGAPTPGGFYCREHATVIIDEYREKLGETWTFQPYAEALSPEDHRSASITVGEPDVCRVHDVDDVVPGRICGRPTPCRDYSSEQRVTIPEAAWRNRSSDGSVLCASVWICGCPMHVEAHAVTIRDGWQVDVGESEFDALHRAFECQGQLQTVTIRGRAYVLFAVAYG